MKNSIKILRVKEKKSLIKLANELGITAELMESWEEGIMIPPTEKLMELSKILHSNCDAVLIGEQRKPLIIADLKDEQKKVVLYLYNVFVKITRSKNEYS